MINDLEIVSFEFLNKKDTNPMDVYPFLKEEYNMERYSGNLCACRYRNVKTTEDLIRLGEDTGCLVVVVGKMDMFKFILFDEV